MLMVGTSAHLEDLDRQYTIAEDVSVTAIAAPRPDLGGERATVHVLLDAQRIAAVGEYEVAPVASLPGLRGQCMVATGRGLLVGTEGAHLLELRSGGSAVEQVHSFDAVPGRDTWENPAAPTPDLRSMAVTSSGTWLVNVHVGGLWRSTDGGVAWSTVIPPEADVHEVSAGGSGRVVVAAARGLGWSEDDGLTWSWTTDGLHAAYSRAVALDGDDIFVTASTGPSSTDGRLYRGRLGGALEQCSTGLPGSFPFNIDSGTLTARDGRVAFGTPKGEVYESTDGGSRFDLLAERMHAVQALRYC
jgi:hypothetical protein